MASKNKLLSKGGVVEAPVKEPETPIDLLPDVAYPTWMAHTELDSILVNSKQEYYDAVKLGYFATDRQIVKN